MKMGLAALGAASIRTVADMLLFRALRDRLGFTRLSSAATGGAALGPDTFRFFQAMGVPLRQLYGQTELLGAYTLHRVGEVDFDTVGVAFGDDIELRVDKPDANGVGEIVTRHPNMFPGYYVNDLRRRPAGRLAAHRRCRLFQRQQAAGGDRPHQGHRGDRARRALLAAIHREQAEVQPLRRRGRGARRRADALAAMICIRFPIVSKWAERKRISFTTYTDLASRPEVYALLRKEVETVNATLPPAQRISRFLLLYKELDADDEELTRTRKVRRGVINEKYGDIIDGDLRRRRRHSGGHHDRLPGRHEQRIRTTLAVVDSASRAVAKAAE